ncbi:MAG: O-antigen ligase family protein [Pseudobdellovibrionaceae bacterium]|nr:O-antigen ligase family protein [Pseudobdellovibrionaceae bacterium]
MLKTFCQSNLPSIALGLILILGLYPQSGDNPFMLAPTLLLTGALIFFNRLTKIPTNDPMLLLILGLYLTWGATGLASAVPFPTKVTWVIFAVLPLTYLYVRTFSKTDLTGPLALFGSALALHIIYEYAQGINRPDSIFDDSNLAGITLAICILAAQMNKRTSYALFLMLPSLFLTESRTALLAIIAGAIMFAALDDKDKLKQFIKGKMFRYSTLAILVMLGLNLYMTGFGDRILNTVEQSQGRIAIWTASLTMAAEHPLTGFGLGTFHLNYPPFRLEGDDSLGLMAHNEPLQTAVESGWIAMTLLYAIFGLGLYRAVKTRNKFSASILSVLFVSIHLTYPLHVVGLMMILAISLAKTAPTSDEQIKTPILFSSVLLITFLCTTIIALSAGYTFLLWREASSAAKFQDQGKFDAAITACFNQGDKQFPDCHVMAARFLSLSQKSDPNELEYHLLESYRRNPLNPELPYLRARFLQIREPHNTEQLPPLLDESLRRDPTYWRSREMAIKLLMAQNNYKDAKKYLEQGLIYPYSGQVRDIFITLRAQINAHLN